MSKSMNKAIRILLLQVIFASGIAAQSSSTTPIKPDRDHDRLIGPVKSVRLEMAKLKHKSTWGEKRRTLQRTISYDPQGNITRQTIYIDRPTLTDIRYSYEKDGNRGESIVRETPPGESVSYRTYGTVGGDGRSIRVVRRVFKHDASGNRIEETVYGSRGGAVSISGSPIAAIVHHAYDEKSQRRQTVHVVDGLAVERQVFSYDDRGNITDMAQYSGGGHLLRKESYTYEFDAIGNWIKRSTSEWKKRGTKSHFEPEEVTYRIIEYYEQTATR